MVELNKLKDIKVDAEHYHFIQRNAIEIALLNDYDDMVISVNVQSGIVKLIGRDTMSLDVLENFVNQIKKGLENE